MLRRHAVKQRQDHGVDGDRLARTRGTGNEKMRHLGKIGDDGFAADGLAERHGELGLAVFKVAAADQFTQEHGFTRLVRKLDANGVAARHDGNARGDRAHGAGDVIGKANDA